MTNRGIRVVHIHTAAGGSFTKHLKYARLARTMGRKVVFHCHASSFKDWYETLPENRRRGVLSGINKLDCLIVLSGSWREYFISIGVGADKIRILNNIVPVPMGAIDKDLDSRELRLLFLGEIGPRKGVFDLLAAMKDVGEDVFLDIGGNKMEAELKERIQEYGLSGKVYFHGFVSGEEKEGLLRKADVFVLPSYNEGLPVSILEAMSYGCAIISTKVGGIPELVRKNGILVTPGDVMALTDAIVSMKDKTKCVAMGQLGRDLVKDYYPDSVIAELREIYCSLL